MEITKIIFQLLFKFLRLYSSNNAKDITLQPTGLSSEEIKSPNATLL